MWYAVIGKGGEFIYVLELPIALTIEAGPEVRNEDLGPLKEANGLAPALKLVLVAEGGEVPCKDVDERRG